MDDEQGYPHDLGDYLTSQTKYALHGMIGHL